MSTAVETRTPDITDRLTDWLAHFLRRAGASEALIQKLVADAQYPLAEILADAQTRPRAATIEMATKHLRDDLLDSVQNAILDCPDYSNQETMSGLALCIDQAIADFGGRVLVPPATNLPHQSRSYSGALQP